MSELETKAVDLLNKMEALTETYAPEVLNKAVDVMQMASIANLIETFVFLLTGIGLVIGAYYWNKYAMKKYDEISRSNDWDTGAFVGGVVGAVLGSIMALVSFLCLFDVWMWIGIFNPETALAYKVLGL